MINEATISNDVLRPTHVVVDLDAIEHNYKVLTDRAGDASVLFVLKANAYGHGLVPIAKKLESLGADYFGVAYLEEGILLRESGVMTPVLVMGGIVGDQIPLFIKYDLTITASSVTKLQQIEKTAAQVGARAKAHLKIDTGMERIGIHYYSAEALIKAARECHHTDVEGIFTHFANADLVDDDQTKLQQERFEKVLSLLTAEERSNMFLHCANSGAFSQGKAQGFTMLRLGILLYGIYPSLDLPRTMDLKPALSWKTKVVFFKVVKPGHSVSYGGSWTPTVNSRVVTLPVGYGDGYFRMMSNQAKVLIRGIKYPQVGAICMDQCMVNIADGTAYNTDEVILIGRQGDKAITVEDLAKWAQTIPYEILTNINTRVPRVYVGDRACSVS